MAQAYYSEHYSTQAEFPSSTVYSNGCVTAPPETIHVDAVLPRLARDLSIIPGDQRACRGHRKRNWLVKSLPLISQRNMNVQSCIIIVSSQSSEMDATSIVLTTISTQSSRGSYVDGFNYQGPDIVAYFLILPSYHTVRPGEESWDSRRYTCSPVTWFNHRRHGRQVLHGPADAPRGAVRRAHRRW